MGPVRRRLVASIAAVCITAGTTLRSGADRGRFTRNSRNLPTHGSSDRPESAADSDRSPFGPLPSSCSHRLTSHTFDPLAYFEKSMTMS